ncbi:hypothetical protein CU098_012141 [Rhizopus stolonifer]|uniref:Uncharacterized protein n=1 Tax=Rhizopus stolonifer TaxID=4846 RepID=A0A367KQC5_RHIST|nr:hypothetical protein CU098_012141 [Rhizopus stolonifer]
MQKSTVKGFDLKESNNRYDDVLFETYRLHRSNIKEGRLESSDIATYFMWSHQKFPRGTKDDPGYLIRLFLRNLSCRMRLFCQFKKVVRNGICSNNPSTHFSRKIQQFPLVKATHLLDDIVFDESVTFCKECGDDIASLILENKPDVGKQA